MCSFMSSPLFVSSQASIIPDSISRAQSVDWPTFNDDISIEFTPASSSISTSSARFRFRGRYCLLTYSQVPTGFDPQDIVDHLHRDNLRCIVCRELHQDGGTHYHAFVDYLRVRDFTGAHRWDVQNVHPNVKRIQRTPWKAYDYCRKDNSIVHECFTGLDRPTEPRRPSGQREPCSKRKWTEITNAQSEADFLQKCLELDPRALCVSWNSIKAYTTWRYPNIRREYANPDGLTIDICDYRELREYLHDWLRQRGR